MSPHRKLELQRAFIAALALFISAIFLWMIRDYLAALFLAAVVTLFLARPHDWLTARLGKRRGLAAGLLVTVAVLAFVIPAAILLGLVAEQAIEVTGMVTPWVQEQVSQILSSMIYGTDGFFFVYDYDGTNLVSPRQTDFITRNWT